MKKKIPKKNHEIQSPLGKQLNSAFTEMTRNESATFDRLKGKRA